MLGAGCGGDGGMNGDDAPGDGGIDAGLACGQELCDVVGARCGMAIDGCGDVVDCGQCTYEGSDVAADAVEPAIAIHGEDVLIAYVTTAPAYEVRLAVGDGAIWKSELVAALAGEPRGPVDLVVGPDGTRWVVFVDDQARIHAAWAPPLGPWTVDEPLAVGSAVAIALEGDGAPVIALAGLVESTSGVFVAEHDGTKWELTPVGEPTAGGAPRSIALSLKTDEIDLVWRDPGTSTLRFASGRGTAYALEVVDPIAATPADDGALSLARGPLARPRVLYGRGPGDLVLAVRTGETWQGTVLSSADADRDNALVAGGDGALRAAAFESHGLAVIDGLGGAWLFQTVVDDCDDGDVDLAVDSGGGVHLAYACTGAVRYLVRPPIVAE